MEKKRQVGSRQRQVALFFFSVNSSPAFHKLYGVHNLTAKICGLECQGKKSGLSIFFLSRHMRHSE